MDLKQTIRIFYDGSGATQAVLGLGKVQTSANATAAASARMGKALTAALGATVIGALFAVAKAFKKGADDFRTFNLEMTKSLSIMTGVTKAQKRQMEELAKSTSVFMNMEIGEVAKSYFFLASAGLDAVQSIGALPEVAKFAKAGAFDMATATDLSTDALSALGLKSADAVVNLENLVRVQDVLVKANTLSNATVEQFSESLTNRAANAMRSVNMEVEAGAAVLAVWADQGVKGAFAGTRFEIVIRDLMTASRKFAGEFEKAKIDVFDSGQSFRNLADIVEDMEKSFGGMTTKQQAAAMSTLGFTDRSIAATRSLLGYSESIRDYEKKLKDAGGTTDLVARKQMAAFDEQIGKIGKRMRVSLITGVEPFMNGLNSLFTSINKGQRTSQELIDDLKATNAELTNLGEAKSALKTLNDLGDGQKLSADESKRLALATETLTRMFPDMVKEYDDAGKALSFYNEMLGDAIDLKVQVAKTTLRSDLDDLGSSKSLSEFNLQDAKRRQGELFTERKKQADKNRNFIAEGRQDSWLGKYNLGDLENTVKNIAAVNLEISQYEAELALIDRQVGAIVDIVGKESVVDALFSSGKMSFDEALAYLDKIIAKVKKVKPEDSGPKAGAISLDKEIADLEKRKKDLIDMKDATGELADVNRELFLLYAQQDELENRGLEGFKKAAEDKKEADEEEKRRLKDMLEWEEKIALIKKNNATIKKVELMPLEEMDDKSFRALLKAYKTIDNLQKKFESEENRIKMMFPFDEERQEIELEKLKATMRTAMEEVAKDIEKALEILDPDTADLFRKAWANTGDMFKKPKEDTKKIKADFTHIARSARALLQLGDVFGTLSDGARNFADGILSILDNIGSLKDLSEGAGFLEKLTPILGIGGGAVSILASVIGDGKSVEDAIKENTRRIEKAVRDLAEDPRPTGDNTTDELDELKRLFIDAITASGEAASPVETKADMDRAQKAFKDLFDYLDKLELAGVPQESLDALRKQLLNSFSTHNREVFDDEGFLTGFETNLDRTMLAQSQLFDLLKTFLGSSGGFATNNVAGILAGASALQDLGAGSAQEVFDLMLEQLIALVASDSDAFALLSQLRTLNPKTDSASIAQLVSDATRQIVGGSGFDFGNITPEEFDDILRRFSELSSGEGAVDDDFQKSVQIGRSITEIQANEWIAIGESQLLRLTQIKDLLQAQRGSGGGSGSGGGGGGFEHSSTLGVTIMAPIGITISGTDEQAIQRIMYELEQKVRLAIREGRTA